MKNKLYYFLMAMLLVAACTPEVDDVFDQSASQRIDAVIAHDKEVLCGAANGWVMQYYPSSTRTYGGYTMLVSFSKEGKANVSCDLFAQGKVVSSLYEVKQSMGAMLTFDTYNEVFHFFAEPSNKWGIGDTGKGMEGDYEFAILECTPDKVVLKGKKTGNKMIMTPIPAGTSWSTYLGLVKDITAQAYPAVYDVYVDGNVKYSVTQKHHTFILENVDGSQQSLPFAYTTEGIRFYEPVSIGLHKVQELAWNDAQQTFGDGNVQIKAQALPEGYTKYHDFVGSYVMVYGDGTQRPVTVEEELFNESFLMKGFAYDIRLRYNADLGTISIESQQLNGNIYLCAWSLGGGGKLTASAGTGMTGGMQPYMGMQVVMFKDNGAWKYPVDSFVAFDIQSGDSFFQIGYLQALIKL